ncbi:MAG: orotidine 5'-phosphate decarboxylase, partial [Candidatus Nealsonbacteria bacterium]|nr:orotidine 5'-phosphate decarboxylase [Candidatus Nealsonbacteria bacterium]
MLEGRKVAPKDCVIFPLDGVDPVGAALLVEELADYVGYFKIGLGLNSVMGTPQAVQMVHSRGGKAFVDLKINDIPNTVADAVKALSAQGVAMINIHASAEIDAMMEVAKYKGNSIAYAVTVLTSQDEEE